MFRIALRGTAIVLERDFEGAIRNGDQVLLVTNNGLREVRVKAVEAVDGIGGDRRDFAVALPVDSLEPKDVLVGSEVTKVEST